jgi:signal transduction histidine kinase/Tfp pilus assembly protein PilF
MAIFLAMLLQNFILTNMPEIPFGRKFYIFTLKTGHDMLRTSFPIALLLCMVLASPSPAQDMMKVDSLVTLLNDELHDSVRMRIAFDIAFELGTTDTSTARTYLEAGKAMAERREDQDGLGRYYMLLGLMNSNLGNYNLALVEYDRALANFLDANDHLRYYQTLKNKGNVYLFMAEYDQAMNLYETALEYYRREDNILGISRCLNNMGVIHKNRGEYVEALSAYQESLRYLDPERDALDISQAYINMGNIYVFLGSYDEALNQFERALEIARKLNNHKSISLCLSNQGVVQNKCGNYEEALDLYERSLDVSRSINDPVQISNCLINIGTNYADMGEYEKGLDFVQKGMEMKMELGEDRIISNCYTYQAEIYMMMEEYEKAIELYNKAIPVKKELGDQEGLVRCYLGLGSVLMHRRQYREAENMVGQGLAIADTIMALEHLANGYDIEREIALARGDFKNAYRYAEIHQQYKDSLMDEATTLAVKEIEYRNHSLALQQENENLKVQSELTQELMRKRNALFYSLLGVALLLATGLVLVAYFLRRLRISSLKLEEKNLVITRQNLKLDQLNKNKDQMMSIIAHDLRGTIGNQLSAIEVLHQIECGEEEGIDRKKLFGNLKHSASYSLELLENLLHWSRLADHESNFYPEEVDLESLVGNCSSLYDEAASSKNITLNVHTGSPMKCRVDRIMFETIVRNLISNAIKFSNPGGSIDVNAEARDGMIHFSVTDRGIGMDPEQLTKISGNSGFTRRGTANEKGAGIGLTLVREFTTTHKGKLRISSKPGKGSTFEVVIPCRN